MNPGVTPGLVGCICAPRALALARRCARLFQTSAKYLSGAQPGPASPLVVLERRPKVSAELALVRTNILLTGLKHRHTDLVVSETTDRHTHGSTVIGIYPHIDI